MPRRQHRASTCFRVGRGYRRCGATRRSAHALASSRHSISVTHHAGRSQLREDSVLSRLVSGRDVVEARQNSAYFLMNEPDRAKPIAVDVDRQAKRVRVTVDQVTRTAAFYGDQGCVIHPIDDETQLESWSMGRA